MNKGLASLHQEEKAYGAAKAASASIAEACHRLPGADFNRVVQELLEDLRLRKLTCIYFLLSFDILTDLTTSSRCSCS